MSKQLAQISTTDLYCGDLTLQLVPQLGGSIFGFWWKNTPLLRPTQPTDNATLTARQTASFPLIPFSNRIANAAFNFLGRHYVLPRDHFEPRHALHGNAFYAAWEVEEHTPHYARIFLAYEPERQDIPYFPFSYNAWQSFYLQEDRLIIEMKIKNCDTKILPAGMGHHLYFPRQKTTKLQFNAERCWESDETLLPLKPSTVLKALFSAGTYVNNQVLDNCFEGWAHTAKISDETTGHELNVQCSNDFSYAVLYTPERKDYFAFEPVTHLNNAINMQGLHGIKHLNPGETWLTKLNLIFKEKASFI